MKIAVISDIHGNLYALEAVLKDIDARGAGGIYCTGDLVGYGPCPNEVIEIIRKMKIPAVMGNYDDAIGNMRFVCGCDYKDEKSLRLGERSIAWTKDHTSDENKLWLRDLPSQIRLSVSGLELLLVHGSPGAINEYLYEDTPEDYIDQILAGSRADVLICGHTHIPYAKRLRAGFLVNAGSAGKPKHGNPNATYALVEAQGGLLQVDIVEVRYDFERTAREIENSGLPVDFAEIIRTGRG